MFDILFGKKPVETTSRKPWDKVRYRSIEVPVWKSENKDGSSRFTYGISRPYQVGSETFYAKTYGPENLWDMVNALEQFFRAIQARKDISEKQQPLLSDIVTGLECMVSLPSRYNPRQDGLIQGRINGHGEPNF